VLACSLPNMLVKFSCLIFSGSISRLPFCIISRPEPTALQSALSPLESALLPCFACLSFFSPFRKLEVLVRLDSVSSHSSSRISLELGYLAVRLLSPSFYVMLSSLNRPPPLLGPVPRQNFSSSKECVDEPVTSHIYDEKVGERCDVFRFCVEFVCR